MDKMDKNYIEETKTGKINIAEFITSAVDPKGYPVDNRFEIAIVGRSNVGKSTLINTITNRRKLARVSCTPGKTRLINFFLINDDFYLVDLPGYGYAKVSRVEQAKWGEIVKKYLLNRPQLRSVILLLDIRREPNEDDLLMRKWIKYYGYETIVVTTKGDKVSKADINRSTSKIKKALEMGEDEIIINFSSVSKIGLDKVIQIVTTKKV